MSLGIEGTLLFILVVHFVADFILQSDAQAKGKSTSLRELTSHIATYNVIWCVSLLLLVDVTAIQIVAFGIITFTCHWITDFCTSRWGKIYWDRGDTHNGFCVVGFDQILHYVQLYLTFKTLGML